MKTYKHDLRSRRADRFLSGVLSRAAGSNFDHDGNEERIPRDIGPRETRVHRKRDGGDLKEGAREKNREGDR